MVHFSSITVIQLCFLLLARYACLTSGLYLEDKIIQLEKNFMKMKEDFDVKVVNLETKVARLEAHVEHQESIITALMKNERDKKSSTKNVSATVEMNQKYKKDAILRTCQEVHLSNPLLDSGMYWIDPDGQGVGDKAISVFCNMTSGSTSILHDSESEIDVGKCSNPGCYSRKINYYATERQIAALIELSSNCSQSIRYNCNNAPLTREDVTYSWWNDKNGNKKTFSETWISNCNAGGAAHAIGVIQSKQELPVMRLNFGGTSEGSGQHKLERLQCSGKVNVEGMPASCEDLWRIGNTMNGLFSIVGNKKVQSVYCDFNKRPNEKGFQKWIGYADVKSVPAYFYVTRNSSYKAKETPVPYHLTRLNIGNAMDIKSGKFTAPREGTYFFSFTGTAEFPASATRVWLGVDLYKNGYAVARARVEEVHTVKEHDTPLTLQSTLNLKSGDTIWVQIYDLSSGAYLFDNSRHYTHFTGWMVEETFVASL